MFWADEWACWGAFVPQFFLFGYGWHSIKLYIKDQSPEALQISLFIEFQGSLFGSGVRFVMVGLFIYRWSIWIAIFCCFRCLLRNNLQVSSMILTSKHLLQFWKFHCLWGYSLPFCWEGLGNLRVSLGVCLLFGWSARGLCCVFSEEPSNRLASFILCRYLNFMIFELIFTSV